jgi:hypothetical protein
VEVRAAAPNVCTFTTVAEEAIIFWIFVSEGEDWIQEFKAKKKNILKPEDNEDDETDGDVNTSTSRKKMDSIRLSPTSHIGDNFLGW